MTDPNERGLRRPGHRRLRRNFQEPQLRITRSDTTPPSPPINECRATTLAMHWSAHALQFFPSPPQHSPDAHAHARAHTLAFTITHTVEWDAGPCPPRNGLQPRRHDHSRNYPRPHDVYVQLAGSELQGQEAWSETQEGLKLRRPGQLPRDILLQGDSTGTCGRILSQRVTP